MNIRVINSYIDISGKHHSGLLQVVEMPGAGQDIVCVCIGYGFFECSFEVVVFVVIAFYGIAVAVVVCGVALLGGYFFKTEKLAFAAVVMAFFIDKGGERFVVGLVKVIVSGKAVVGSERAHHPFVLGHFIGVTRTGVVHFPTAAQRGVDFFEQVGFAHAVEVGFYRTVSGTGFFIKYIRQAVAVDVLNGGGFFAEACIKAGRGRTGSFNDKEQ